MSSNIINNLNLVIINWNANGIKKNRNTFAAFLSAHNVYIACVSETHLIASDKIKFNGYTTYRKDRIAVRPSGGVAIIIKSKIKHQLTYLPATKTLEAVAISITINQSITTIISAYQSSSFQMYINDFEKILNSYQKIILVGDLNCKHTTWYCKSTNANGRKLYKYLASNPAILSAPDTPTYNPYDQSRSPDILDVIILKSIRFSMHQEPLFELDSDHLPVKITLDASLSFSTPTRKLITGNADWQKFKQHITTNLIIPKNILNINSADTAVTHLREIICQAAEVCSEQKNTVINYSPNQLPLNIVKLIKSKHQTRRLWQLYRQPLDRKKLNYLTKEVKRQLEEHRINSYQKYLSAIHPIDSNLWTATKRLIKPNSNEIPPLKASGIYLNTDSEKCELFAHTLENTFTLNNSAIKNSTDNLVKQKLHIIKKLPKRKSPGHDLITNAILKYIPRKAITYLAIILNFLIKIEYFPKEWKLATIIMIKKPGKDNTDPRNYRPICLLSSVSKIFEKIIHSRLTNYLNAINAIPHFQFGFKSNHSTTQQLLRLTEHISNGYEKKQHTGAAFLNVAQALDRVWYDGLLYKLKILNTPNAIFNLIKSYLTARRFKVKINDTPSQIKIINAGVFQGSKISPLLFNIYVSDFSTSINTEIALYADDSAIYSSSTDVETVTKNMQDHLNGIQIWGDKWKIKLNPQKSTAVLFTNRRPKTPGNLKLYGNNIPWSPSIKYLGVILDRKLTWNPQITSKLQQGYQRLKILYPLLNRQSSLSWKCFILLYKQILQPLLLYAVPVWGNCAKTHIHKIQIFQSKVLRTKSNAPWFIRNAALHTDFQLPSITDYIKKLTINFFNHLESASSAKYYNLSVPPSIRRLKRGRQHDLLR
ncbi:hypothetical protein QTP88_020289 [Uroleucon formosanum]